MPSELAPARAPLTDHPAKFSDTILERLHRIAVAERRRLGRWPRTLDPFAGVGRIHRVQPEGTVGVELEPEWAACHRQTIVGDATALPFDPGSFDVVMTSPCYGNRMADSHEARDGSRRMTYRHRLGRMPSAGSAAVLQWGPAYRELHRRAWVEARRVLVDDGLLVVNVSDHVRDGVVQRVVLWHANAIGRAGFDLVSSEPVATPRMGFGENREARVDAEIIMCFRAAS